EIPLAIYIDLVMPKRRIMEIYLNIAEWGPEGQFGVAAGARRAFGNAPQKSRLAHGNAACCRAAQPDAAQAGRAQCQHEPGRRHYRGAGAAIWRPGPVRRRRWTACSLGHKPPSQAPAFAL